MQVSMASNKVVHHSPELQKCLSRGSAFEMPHRLVSLFYVFVVPLDRIVVVPQAIPSASYWHAVHEPRNPVEVPIEHRPVLLEPIGHKSDQLTFFRRSVLFPPENRVYPLPNAFFQLFEKFSHLFKGSALDEPAVQIVLGLAVYGV